MLIKKSLLSGIAKYLAPFGAVTLLALSFVAPVSAQSLSSTDQQKCAATDVKCVIAFGDQRITDRQTALDKLSTKVTTEKNNKHISDDDASSLQSDIKANKDGLATLKAKLDAETTAKDAREDVKNIYSQYRIYAVVLPRDARQLHYDVELHLYNKLADAQSTVEQSINNAPADKKDNLNNLFSDYKTQLADAKTQLDTAQPLFSKLTPTEYNTDRDTYNTNEASLKSAEETAHKDLHKAADDLHKIAQAVKKDKK